MCPLEARKFTNLFTVSGGEKTHADGKIHDTSLKIITCFVNHICKL